MATVTVMIDWEKQPCRDVSELAARRAIVAHSLAHTARDDVAALNDRVAALEGLCEGLLELVEQMIREKGQ